jgi:hypothetical protein
MTDHEDGAASIGKTRKSFRKIFCLEPKGSTMEYSSTRQSSPASLVVPKPYEIPPIRSFSEGILQP